MNSTGKIILIIVIVAIAGFVAYTLISDDGQGDAGPLRSTTNQTGQQNGSAEQEALSREFLVTLLNLNSLTLDAAVLSDPAFQALRDYTVILVPEGNEGRLNPFAPIGVDPEETNEAS